MIHHALLNGAVFDGALGGALHWLHLDDHGPQRLPVNRWHGVPDTGDKLMLNRCRGATLDIGCGPGRLTNALAIRGEMVLGIDISSRAVGLTLRRGVFGPLPGMGRRKQALLADGNIGIGGDSHRLLCRVRQLLDRRGSVIIEVEPPGIGMRRGRLPSGLADECGAAMVRRAGVDLTGSLPDSVLCTVVGHTVHSGRTHRAQWSDTPCTVVGHTVHSGRTHRAWGADTPCMGGGHTGGVRGVGGRWRTRSCPR